MRIHKGMAIVISTVSVQLLIHIYPVHKDKGSKNAFLNILSGLCALTS